MAEPRAGAGGVVLGLYVIGLGNMALLGLLIWYVTGVLGEGPGLLLPGPARERSRDVGDTGVLITLPDDPQGLV